MSVQGSAGERKRGRPSAGRQKIPMQKIENKEALQVSFSKRRQGLFKKASEISILCGAQIAIIVFSPGGKAYSFGNPSVDSVIDRFLFCLSPGASTSSSANYYVNDAQVVMLQQQYIQLQEQLRGNHASSSLSSSANWWEEEPIEEMGIDELQGFYERLAAFRKLAVKRWGIA